MSTERIREGIAVWLYDLRAAVTGRKVYYGPNHSRSPWRELGDYAWGCNQCDGEAGGYEPTRYAAQRVAEDHAGTHRGVRAYYSEG